METKKNYNWDDLIFEYKNKEYGAFILRNKYIKDLIAATFIGILILVLVVYPVHIMYNHYEDSEILIIDNSITVDLMNIMHQKEEAPPPTQLPPLKEKKHENLSATQIVDNVKEEIVIPESTQVYDTTLKNNIKEVALTDSSFGNSDGTLDYFTIEEKPEFPGGESAMMKWIASNVKYPDVAIENKITGKVFILFVINKEGKVSNVELLVGVNPCLDKEALRVVSNMPNWKPGKQRGKPIKVSYKLPINFKL